MWASYVFNNKRIEVPNLEMYANSIIFIHFNAYVQRVGPRSGPRGTYVRMPKLCSDLLKHANLCGFLICIQYRGQVVLRCQTLFLDARKRVWYTDRYRVVQ